MAKSVVIDELHVTIRIPTDLGEDETEAVRATLMGSEFMTRMREAIRELIQNFPELTRCRVTLSR